MATNDDFIFQEAKRINVAIFQRIALKEFYQHVLGEEIFGKFQLDPDLDRYTNHHQVNDANYCFSVYVPSLSPSILNEFSAAAHRFGHALIPDETMVREISPNFNHLIKIAQVEDEFINRLSTSFLNPGGKYSDSSKCNGNLFTKSN